MKRRELWTVAAVVLAVIMGPCKPAHSDIPARIQPMTLSALEQWIENRDRPCFIAVMAAWCGPCIKELPVLNKLHLRYKKRGFAVIGISVDLQGPSAMQRIADQIRIHFPVYRVGEKAVEAYDIKALPMIWIVKSGAVVERLAGIRAEAFLENKIKALLSPAKGSY